MEDKYGLANLTIMPIFPSSSDLYQYDTAKITAHYMTSPTVPAPKTDQQLIDEAVRETLEKPKRDKAEQDRLAEIERRTKLIESAGADENEIGTVITFTRDFSGDKTYLYAALKTGDDTWYVTGNYPPAGRSWTWEKLIEWMVTGAGTVKNVKRAGDWIEVFS